MNKPIQLFVRLSGISIIGLSVYFVLFTESQLVKGDWYHLPSLIFVGCVLVGIMLSSYQISKLFQMLANLIFSSPTSLESQMKTLSNELREMSEVYYRHGTSKLGEYVNKPHFPKIWQTLLAQLEAKMPASDIRDLLQYGAKNFEEEVNSQIDILSAMASLAPSIGVLGTVFGLIRLLADLNDVTALGPNMSLALVTTLYGIFFSVLVFKPLASRLQSIRQVNLKAYQQAMFWVYLIEHRKPPFYLDPKYSGRQASA